MSGVRAEVGLCATKHAPHHYVGHIRLRGEPTGYDNGSNQNTASTRVRVKR